MTTDEKLARLALILDELTDIDLGYPQHGNTVAPPTDGAAALLAEAGLSGIEGLVELYSACDGVSMPDVHNGYFIHPLRRPLNVGDPNSEPRAVLAGDEIPVLLIGSTGGGDLFVVERQSGRVLVLPPGLINDGRYEGRRIRVVADTIIKFLDILISDAEAFVRGDRGHWYLKAEE